ncbi:IclR family transcriptional regulator [Saccharopolyspora erythraea NRRL 2338]|uniref:Glycerol operon regulatory protein n=2 Tax=Saccharopolyspora erythraea TaxID=1836 RepID=A4FFG6_SACEN|nr:IclR family transcriptional regulator C-terminal domain-containing protein [Saccharopolyspora erythraea]EQD81675.1 IclR family transcriptional regulator [Saccharopolyspora erythraea D]PFG96512.1 IclR family transcriptional regulator [Saccharopolyspora erythraea NRRL 2338]QRK93003.1 helix-turn-helix domain-containing protein [Saccharopolyspora erythraea]CAM02791.1 transcriptional regulator, IclR family [Saccharopolyspora erythraea NRRL 2338]
MAEERGEHFVKSFERGLSVLRAFSAEHPELTLSEVAAATGLTRAGARRFLLTLVDLGYLRVEGRRFALTPRVLEFGYAFLSGRPLPKIAEPHLHQLAGELHETTSVAILDGTDIYYVARVPSSRLLSVAITVGTRFPAHATSMGKVLLAGLPGDELARRLDGMELRALTPRTITSREVLTAEIERVRERGWAISDGELEEGLHGVAAPLRDRTARVTAAVNVSLQTHSADESHVRREVVPPLLATASRIEAEVNLQPSAPV